jgi:ribulose bisphosphate carboxylase small subunit
MEEHKDMDRLRRIKSWKTFENKHNKEAIDVLADVRSALQDVYDLCLDSIDNGGKLLVMCTIDNPTSPTGGGEYIFSTKFNSQHRPNDYTFDLNNYDEIQNAIDEGAEPEVLVGLTMLDEDEFDGEMREVFDIEATYLLYQSIDKLNIKWDDIIIKCMFPTDYEDNYNYF